MVIICSSCGGACTGEVLKVQDKHFHINCFKCEECGCLLASGGYFPRNNHYYCSKDYHRLFGTCCKSCGEFVEGRVITALGNSYHPECFTCDRCGGEIRSGTVVTYNDKEEILCQKCSPDVSLSDNSPSDFKSPSPTSFSQDLQGLSNMKSPSPSADSANKSTSEFLKTGYNSTNAAHSSSHVSSAALKARYTGIPVNNYERTTMSTSTVFDDVFDFSKVPDIDAETQLHLGKCAQCLDVIRSAQSLIALNRHWHLFCFCCARCKRYLTNEYMDNGDQAYCEPCFQELYGLICETCQEYITGSVLEAGDRHFHPSCAFCCKCSLKFSEGDDLCISGDEVWHLDCDRVSKNRLAGVTSLPQSEKQSLIKPETSDSFSRSDTKKPSVIHSPIPGSGSRSSSRSSSRMTPENLVAYPLKELQLIGKVCLPKGVNRTKLEQHLTDADFFDVFGMDRSSFYLKPQWKQIELKKKANLF